MWRVVWPFMEEGTGKTGEDNALSGRSMSRISYLVSCSWWVDSVGLVTRARV